MAPLYNAFRNVSGTQYCVELVENRRIWQERLEDESSETRQNQTRRRKANESSSKNGSADVDKHFRERAAFKDTEDQSQARVSDAAALAKRVGCAFPRSRVRGARPRESGASYSSTITNRIMAGKNMSTPTTTRGKEAAVQFLRLYAFKRAQSGEKRRRYHFLFFFPGWRTSSSSSFKSEDERL